MLTIFLAYISLGFPPSAVSARAVLLLRHNNDNTVFQIVGTVSKAAARNNYNYVDVRIPWDEAAGLAVWAGKNVEGGEKAVLYDYAAQIKDLTPGPGVT
jgi:hypothetical protein